MRKLLSRSKKQSRKKHAARDYEAIITIQAKIIKAREHTFKIYERALNVISSKSIIKLESMEQELQQAYKDRNEAIRRYNALHQLGEMAEGMGVDLTAKLPEKELAKWDQSSFKVDTKVLESGRSTYSIRARRKIKSPKTQDYTKKNGKSKK